MSFKRKRKHDKEVAKALANWLDDDGPASHTPPPEQDSTPAPQRPMPTATYTRPHAPAGVYRPVPTPTMPPQPPQSRPATAPPAAQTSAPAYRPAPYLGPDTPQRYQQAPTPPNMAYGPSTNVNISISLPKIKKPTLPKLPYKRIAIVTGVAVALIVISLVTYKIVVSVMDHRKAEQAAHALSLAKSTTKPTFTPLLPKGKSQVIGKTAAFDGSRDTYSYSDTFDGTSVLVSQQPIPATFDSVSSGVAKIAKSINATTPIISKVGTAYLSTDSKSGAQTIVFASNGVLVFVQSSFNHAAGDWKYYLDSLAG